MPDRPAPLSIEIVTSIDKVGAADWNRLAHGPRALEKQAMVHTLPAASNSTKQVDSKDEADESTHEVSESTGEVDQHNPFISHTFLNALEKSASVGGRSGWTPLHLLARDETGNLIGAVPAYGKSHSRGEYVFDHAFAEAYERNGLSYYPKLQVSIPFTPATARKLLVAPEANLDRVAPALIAGLDALRDQIDASSVHATFLPPADRQRFLDAGYLLRHDQQFHFSNEGYASFDEFLAALASRKRKVLKRERRDASAAGLEIEWLTGKAITEAHWDVFYAFYMETGSRKWGSPYLTRRFFSLVGETMAQSILLVMAKRTGRYIAGALNFIGGNTLYGRNWGATEYHPFLHFELCYYQAIDFAIAHRLARVEAGAQGEHKLARGYRPVRTSSVHRFADPRFHRAIGDYLARERNQVAELQLELGGMTPFRNRAGN
ncbi:MAG TPA: GNAT family N-acetyltransferase [Rhabdaerophilum sp.]|nr:GNAT family N-acetyltransferase [Rhabdaerophilum sp.]